MADIRRAVLAHLASGADSRFTQHAVVQKVREAVRCDPTEVWEALWRLVGDGLIYLDTAGQGSGTDNWRWRLTAEGRNAVSGGAWEPRDPDGYLARVRRENPQLDALVDLYLVEALRSFNSRCYLATSVMLGVAAERAFIVTATAYSQSSSPGSAAMAKALARRSNYFAAWTEFRKRLEPMRNDLPDNLGDALTMDAVADLIRVTRNEVGHPTGRRIDEDTARVHLNIAPVYLRKMQQLAEHFAALPAPSREVIA